MDDEQIRRFIGKCETCGGIGRHRTSCPVLLSTLVFVLAASMTIAAVAVAIWVFGGPSSNFVVMGAALSFLVGATVYIFVRGRRVP